MGESFGRLGLWGRRLRRWDSGDLVPLSLAGSKCAYSPKPSGPRVQ